jgi:GAF domain-containing protein
VFEGARREIMSLTQATGMSIVLVLPEEDGMLEWIYGYEYGQEVDLSQVPPQPMSEGFSGYVARNREVLHINKDINTLHKQLRSKTIGAFPSSWLGLPLIVANQLIGVMSVENELDDDAFNQRDIDLLRIISGPLAIAINNLRQFEAIQEALAAQSEQRVQLETAAEVAAAATSIRDLDELLDRSVSLIKDRFALYYVGLFLIDSESERAVLRAGTGEAGQIQIRQQHHLEVGGRSLVGGATGDGRPRISQDVSADSEWRPNPLLPETRSELALPLQVRGRVIGALTVQSTAPRRFTPEVISILQTLADQLAVAIENAQLLRRAEARARREQRLNLISAQMHRTVDVDEIIKTGLRALSEQLNGAPVELKLRYGRFSPEEGQETSPADDPK